MVHVRRIRQNHIVALSHDLQESQPLRGLGGKKSLVRSFCRPFASERIERLTNSYLQYFPEFTPTRLSFELFLRPSEEVRLLPHAFVSEAFLLHQLADLFIQPQE